jgi:fermentation-respiration switch protein FrsA (DUF1100 family)
VKLLWMLVGTYLAYAIAMVALHPAVIYPFGPDPFDDPAFRQVGATDRAITVAIAQGDDPLAVLYFMGNGGSLSYFTYSLDAHMEAGRTVAALAYRGGGGVAGKPSEMGLKADALAAYDWLAQQHSGPIAVHGFSLGTGLAVHVAARREVSAILLDAPYTRLCALMTKAAFVPACYMPGVQKWDTVADMAGISAPVLIQHGTADQLIDIGYGRQLAARMRDAGLAVTFESVVGATHNNLAGQPSYAGRIETFLAP